MYMGNHPWVFYKTLYVIHHYLCTVIRDGKRENDVQCLCSEIEA